MKTCRICEKPKPIADFYISNRNKGFRYTRCKTCWSDAAKKRRRDRSPSRRRHELARQRISQRKHRENNREKRASWERDWQRRNRARILPLKKAWKAARTALGCVSAAVIREVFERSKGVCVYCGAKLDDGWHLDHKTPVWRGGTNAKRNLQATCKRCNLSKNRKTDKEYRAWLKKTAP